MQTTTQTANIVLSDTLYFGQGASNKVLYIVKSDSMYFGQWASNKVS